MAVVGKKDNKNDDGRRREAKGKERKGQLEKRRMGGKGRSRGRERVRETKEGEKEHGIWRQGG